MQVALSGRASSPSASLRALPACCAFRARRRGCYISLVPRFASLHPERVGFGRCVVLGFGRCVVLGFGRALALAVVGCALVAQGCGYRLLRPSDAGDLRISVVTLANDSVEPGVELTVTRALREEFLRRPAPRLVADPAAADWVIRGRVLPLTTQPESFDTVALALEYRVELSLALDVTDGAGRALRIDSAALKESELYLASADAEAARKNRLEALRRIADVLAGRIHDAIGLQLAEREAEGAQPAAGEASGGAS